MISKKALFFLMLEIYLFFATIELLLVPVMGPMFIFTIMLFIGHYLIYYSYDTKKKFVIYLFFPSILLFFYFLIYRKEIKLSYFGILIVLSIPYFLSSIFALTSDIKATTKKSVMLISRIIGLSVIIGLGILIFSLDI